MGYELDQIRARRAELKKEDAELEIAERIVLRLSGQKDASVASAPTSSPRPPVSPGGQLLLAASVLPDYGGRVNKAGFRSLVEEKRGSPLTDGAFSTLLSRLTTTGLIVREGDMVSLPPPADDPGEDDL